MTSAGLWRTNQGGGIYFLHPNTSLENSPQLQAAFQGARKLSFTEFELSLRLAAAKGGKEVVLHGVNSHGDPQTKCFICYQQSTALLQAALTEAPRSLRLPVSETVVEEQEVASRVASYLKQNPQDLIIAHMCRFEKVMGALQQQQVTLEGPPTGFFWEIKKADRVVGYLLGSVHFASARALDSLNPKIRAAFDSCDTLGIEDITIQSSNVTERLCRNLIPMPSTGEDPSFDRAFVQAGLTDLNIAIDESDSESFLNKGSVAIARAWRILDSGVDAFFCSQAKAKSMPIVPLESIGTHNARRPSTMGENQRERLPPGVVAADVYATLKGFYERQCEKMSETFIGGSVEVEAISLIEAPSSMQASLDKSNQEIAHAIDQLIQAGKKPFALPGLLHTVSSIGIPKKLEQKGYTMTQISLRTTPSSQQA